MKFIINPEIIIQSFSVLLSSIMIVYLSIKGKKSKILFSYIVCQVLVFIWSMGQILELMSVNREIQWIMVRVIYSAICFIGISWLILCLLYTNHSMISNKRYVLLLFLLPIVLYVLVLTNDLHHLFFSKFELNKREYGTFFWIDMLSQYSYCLIGAVLLIQHSFKNYGYTRKQSILLVSAMTIPLLSNAIYIFKITNSSFDITPASFSLSFCLLLQPSDTGF